MNLAVLYRVSFPLRFYVTLQQHSCKTPLPFSHLVGRASEQVSGGGGSFSCRAGRGWHLRACVRASWRTNRSFFPPRGSKEAIEKRPSLPPSITRERNILIVQKWLGELPSCVCTNMHAPECQHVRVSTEISFVKKLVLRICMGR